MALLQEQHTSGCHVTGSALITACLFVCQAVKIQYNQTSLLFSLFCFSLLLRKEHVERGDAPSFGIEHFRVLGILGSCPC